MQKKEASALFKPIGKLFKKFHLLIFFVFIIGCLSVAVVTTNAILTGEEAANNSPLPGSTPSTPGGASNTIDRATLQRLQSLKQSTEPSSYVPTEGSRSNPFAE